MPSQLQVSVEFRLSNRTDQTLLHVPAVNGSGITMALTAGALTVTSGLSNRLFSRAFICEDCWMRAGISR